MPYTSSCELLADLSSFPSESCKLSCLHEDEAQMGYDPLCFAIHLSTTFVISIQIKRITVDEFKGQPGGFIPYCQLCVSTYAGVEVRSKLAERVYLRGLKGPFDSFIMQCGPTTAGEHGGDGGPLMTYRILSIRCHFQIVTALK